MGQVVILGSSNALPDVAQDNTHMVVKSGERVILIDTSGNTLLRLENAGINVANLNDVVITHFHPDHVAGFPTLLMSLWLSGRRSPLMVYGFRYTLSRIQKMVDLYDFTHWPDFFRLDYQEIPEQEGELILSDPSIRVYGTPVCHFIPTLGLRFDFIEEKKSMVYSCDTEPCDSMIRLAKGADVLIHEATGAAQGHTSAGQAGLVAKKAGAKVLFLIHYSRAHQNVDEMLADAHASFDGAIHLARDLMTLEF